MDQKTAKDWKRRVDKAAITKDSTALEGFLLTLGSKAERTVVLERIEANCMVSRAVIYNWIHGYSRIPELHKREIEKTIGKTIFFDEENA